MIALLRFLAVYFLLAIYVVASLIAEEYPNEEQAKFIFLGGTHQNTLTPFPNDDETRKILKQNQLENEGRKLIKRGFYHEAIEKFRQADVPTLRVSGYQPTIAKGLIREVYWIQGKYDQALAELLPLLETNPKQESYIDEKQELEALISAHDKQATKPVYDYLDFFKRKYKKELPPKKYWFGSLGIATTIIRLYDHIGDSTGGIAFVDQILAYKKLRPKARSEYLKVRESFEHDKKEGFKGCLDAKVGTGCMGRATQVLIQSDYFPW